MHLSETDIKLVASKALFKKSPQPLTGYVSDSDKNSKTIQSKHLADDSVTGPPARLSDLTSLRSKSSNESLRSLINKADTVLARQERLIKDINQLLNMEKAARVYKKASREL